MRFDRGRFALKFQVLTSIGVAALLSLAAAGADDPPWWSLRPVAAVAPPAIDAKGLGWARNPIDAFVFAKLRDKGLDPTAEADRRTLLRRLTFDLHGLPPTPEELNAFLGDPSPDAYDNVVDRLLASPRFGERWARRWMDLVHYAETHGHDQDVPRDHAWPYRDYLIASINADKPYRRFVEEQLAGDVLYPDDPRATVALGFLAAGPWDESSLRDIREDSIDRKAAQYLDRDDMVATVGLTLLSTTIHCARCHAHKFDPVSQTEYFGLQAVFAGIDRANRRYDADPAIHARRIALEMRKQTLQTGGAALAQLLQEADFAPDVAAWENARQAADHWRVLDPAAFASAAGSDIVQMPDRSLRFFGKRPEKDTYTIDAVADRAPIAALRLEALADDLLPHRGPGRQDNGNLHLTEFRVEAAPANDPSRKRTVAIVRAVADFNQSGWEIDKAIDGDKATAWGIFPAVGQSHVAVFQFKEPVEFQGGTRLTVTLEQQHGGGHLLGRVRLSASSVAHAAIAAPVPTAIQTIVAKPLAVRSANDSAELARFVLREKVEADLAALPTQSIVYAAAADFAADGSFRPAMGCRPVHVLRRGDVKQPQALAAPGALDCVADVRFHLANPGDEGQRRAALARWVGDPRNPLTWRSIVNRVWGFHFGRGLVATPSDFGVMGSTPSHPELLDWLTAAFLEDGGSLKKLHRRIVTSATYRQGSQVRPDAAKRDGDNVLLWRMNAQRLDAESLRDAVLSIAGQLDSTMGGPSFRNFAMAPGIHRTPKIDYLASDPDAPGAHRRSVYRFIFRTIPDPFMDALDCPDSSQFTAVRSESVTALQALALLNDPFMVRMSEHFAKRIEAAGPPREQMRRAYQLALGREPTAAEADRLAAYAQRHGLANACRLLLNCNEFVFVP